MTPPLELARAAPMTPPLELARAAPMTPPLELARAAPMTPPLEVTLAAPITPPLEFGRAAPMTPPLDVLAAPMTPPELIEAVRLSNNANIVVSTISPNGKPLSDEPSGSALQNGTCRIRAMLDSSDVTRIKLPNRSDPSRLCRILLADDMGVA